MDKKPFIDLWKESFEGVPENYTFRIDEMSVNVISHNTSDVAVICYKGTDKAADRCCYYGKWSEIGGVKRNFTVRHDYNGTLKDPAELEALCEWVDEQREDFAEKEKKRPFGLER